MYKYDLSPGDKVVWGYDEKHAYGVTPAAAPAVVVKVLPLPPGRDPRYQVVVIDTRVMKRGLATTKIARREVRLCHLHDPADWPDAEYPQLEEGH